jgi:hypothetical protein
VEGVEYPLDFCGLGFRKKSLQLIGWLLALAFANRLRMEQGWCKKSSDFLGAFCSYVVHKGNLPAGGINKFARSPLRPAGEQKHGQSRDF